MSKSLLRLLRPLCLENGLFTRLSGLKIQNKKSYKIYMEEEQ